MNENTKPDHRENIVRRVQIAEALELLERMTREEKDPIRQEALYAQLGEAKCVS